MPPTADPATVPGLPESTLRPEHLAALPTPVPPAPWECRAWSVMWLQRATAPAFDWLGRPTRFTLAGFVEYLDTPVGTYHEVLAGSLVRTGRTLRLQVPFMAVDSVPSVAGGRINWALPKTMASFETDLARATGRAEGDGWSISIEPVRAGRDDSRRDDSGRDDSGRDGTPARRIPIRSRFSSIGPLGVYPTRMRATGRLVRVRTRVDGASLSGWLGSGTHLALVINGRMRIDEPRPI